MELHKNNKTYKQILTVHVHNSKMRYVYDLSVMVVGDICPPLRFSFDAIESFINKFIVEGLYFLYTLAPSATANGFLFT
jgi:hypothetical protein